jgi:hypothetical protein
MDVMKVASPFKTYPATYPYRVGGGNVGYWDRNTPAKISSLILMC